MKKQIPVIRFLVPAVLLSLLAITAAVQAINLPAPNKAPAAKQTGAPAKSTTGTTGKPTPASTDSSSTAASDDKTTKLTNAIVSLYKRLNTLEKKTQAQQAQIQTMQTQIAALQQENATLKQRGAFDRQAIKTLHDRLSLLDFKTKGIVFPSN